MMEEKASFIHLHACKTREDGGAVLEIKQHSCVTDMDRHLA